MEKERLRVFNYKFTEKYLEMNAEIKYDDECGLYYVMHNGKKMYMAKSIIPKKKFINITGKYVWNRIKNHLMPI